MEGAGVRLATTVSLRIFVGRWAGPDRAL